MKHAAFSLLAAIALSACGTTPTVNVPLSFAKLDTGYINSGIYDLGDVLVWDNKNKVFFEEGHLAVPKELEQTGSSVGLQQASLSKDTEIEGLADVSKSVAQATISAAVAHSTTTQLENVNRVTVDAQALVNYDNDITRAWRKKMAGRYVGDQYEFFVVDRVVVGNKLTVSSSASQSAGAGANVISVSVNVKVAVKYNSQNTYTEDAGPGKAATLVIRGTLLRLGGGGADPQFEQVSSQELRAFNVQKAMAARE